MYTSNQYQPIQVKRIQDFMINMILRKKENNMTITLSLLLSYVESINEE